MRQFEEKFGKRVLVSCNDLSFNLQGCIAENEEGPTTNVGKINSLQATHIIKKNNNQISKIKGKVAVS